jgi:nicotinate-nucleotide pyrophosphorylase
VVVVDVEVVDVEVDVEVEVEAAVVTGVVVLVLDNGAEEELATATDEDVEPESVDAGSSLPHAAIVRATRTSGTRRSDFTVGSLARFVTIT